MKKIRALVVDDSLFMRTLISDILSSSGKIDVVGTARNGYEAIEKIKELNPDVMTLDVEMPKMDGLTALERIMNEAPLPVVMVSALTGPGTEATIKALEKGAIDFIMKPSGAISLNIKSIKDDIIQKVIISATIGKDKIKSNISRNIDKTGLKPILSKDTIASRQFNPDDWLIAIGCSTGGPRALGEIIPKLPSSLKAGILIVQHMPPGFTASLAERLNSISNIRVKEAKNSDEVSPGVALIAPGDYHMELVQKKSTYTISLNQNPPHKGVRPSVDILFNSIARNCKLRLLGIILTGMGSDGALGVKEIKNRNGKVIIQDKESCVVFGMPGAALATNCVDETVSLHNIAKRIEEIVISEEKK